MGWNEKKSKPMNKRTLGCKEINGREKNVRGTYLPRWQWDRKNIQWNLLA